MDTRYIQTILAHASLEPTQICTRVRIKALKALHTAVHPGRMPSEGRHGLESDEGASAEPPAIPD